MIAKLLVFGTVCFAIGVWIARYASTIINKLYVEHFYISCITLRASPIGDCEFETIAYHPKLKEAAKVTGYLYSNVNIAITVDTLSTNVDISKTRLYLHDAVSLLPYKAKYDHKLNAYKAYYKLPRPLIAGKSLRIWFFN